MNKKFTHILAHVSLIIPLLVTTLMSYPVIAALVDSEVSSPQNPSSHNTSSLETALRQWMDEFKKTPRFTELKINQPEYIVFHASSGGRSIQLHEGLITKKTDGSLDLKQLPGSIEFLGRSPHNLILYKTPITTKDELHVYTALILEHPFFKAQPNLSKFLTLNYHMGDKNLAFYIIKESDGSPHIEMQIEGSNRRVQGVKQF